MQFITFIIYLSGSRYHHYYFDDDEDDDDDDDDDDYYYYNHDYIKILESDWSSAGLISAVIGQLHTLCACNWTVVRVMPE